MTAHIRSIASLVALAVCGSTFSSEIMRESAPNRYCAVQMDCETGAPRRQAAFAARRLPRFGSAEPDGDDTGQRQAHRRNVCFGQCANAEKRRLRLDEIAMTQAAGADHLVERRNLARAARDCGQL